MNGCVECERVRLWGEISRRDVVIPLLVERLQRSFERDYEEVLGLIRNIARIIEANERDANRLKELGI